MSFQQSPSCSPTYLPSLLLLFLFLSFVCILSFTLIPFLGLSFILFASFPIQTPTTATKFAAIIHFTPQLLTILTASYHFLLFSQQETTTTTTTTNTRFLAFPLTMQTHVAHIWILKTTMYYECYKSAIK